MNLKQKVDSLGADLEALKKEEEALKASGRLSVREALSIEEATKRIQVESNCTFRSTPLFGFSSWPCCNRHTDIIFPVGLFSF